MTQIWRIPDGFEELSEVVLRNNFAQNLSKRNAADICKAYVYLTFQQMQELLRIGLRHAPKELSGIGVELGAGVALLSSATISVCPKVEKMYSVEIVSGFPKLIQPKIAEAFIKKDQAKLIPTVGSFDNIELPNESVDFIVEIGSLHHSHHLEETLKEAARVLKPNGLILAFDRSHPDNTTDEQIEAMLNIVYDQTFIKSNHYIEGTILTRRENGEHEIRYSEWIRAFEKNNLNVLKTVFIHKKPKLRDLVLALCNLYLPKVLFNKISKSRKSKANSRKQVKLFFNGLKYSIVSFVNKKHELHSREKRTLFVCQKR